MDLSIVVVNWNTRELLAGCLESTGRAVDGLSAEVLVVDNASTDDSVAMVRDRFPQVQLIVNRQNVGFARGNNQALRAASGRYVLLLNSDTEVYPGAFTTLVEFLDAHPAAGAAGPRLINPDGSLQASCYPMPSLLRECWRLFHLDRLAPVSAYRMQDWDLRSPRQVDTVQGACMLLRSAALAKVGLLDETYFMYTEEIDLCHRLACAGWPIYWVPEAQVIHFGGQSTRQSSAEMFLQLYRSKHQFFQKTRGSAGSAVYKLILLAAAAARVAMTPLAYLLPDARRAQALTKSVLYRRLIADLFRL